MAGVKRLVMDGRVPLGMLLVQLIAIGMLILSRVILNEGTFTFALLTYRHIVAALSIAPFALYFEGDVIKKLNLAAFFWLFMAALTGIIMAMGLFYYGLKDTNATYATNFLNLIPVFTFLFATIFRIEKLGLDTRAGKVKTLGAILCLAGALTIALYKGKSFHLSHYYKESNIIVQAKQNKTRGTMILIGSCLSYGIWFIIQVKLFGVFPYKYWATLITCVIASAQAAVVGVCINRKPEAWRLGWNLQLITVVYSGMLSTGATFSLISWAIADRGPIYPSMFNPLALILITIFEAIFLGTKISIGSLLGMGLIIMGLYSFLWGKHQNIKAAMLSFKERRGGGGGAGDIEGAAWEATVSESPKVAALQPHH